MRIHWNERLNNWAPEPPAGAWERLSEALPQTPQPEYAQKLYDFSAPPPPAIWEIVAAQLDAPTIPATPVIRMAPRNKWVRMGSVAASILVAVFFLRPFFSGNEPTTDESNIPALQQSVLPLEQLHDRSAARPENILAATPANSKTNNGIPATSNNILPPKDNDPLPTVQTSRTPSAAHLHLVANDAAAKPLNSIVDRYIVLASENNAVRLPKKLYAAYRCDDQPDPAACFEYLAALRKQMASPALLAPADFSGLLEVIQSVDKKQ